MRPHRWQPTRLPRPWYSPGKNTGVGCHFLLQCMKVKSESAVAQSCPTLASGRFQQSLASHGWWQHISAPASDFTCLLPCMSGLPVSIFLMASHQIMAHHNPVGPRHNWISSDLTSKEGHIHSCPELTLKCIFVGDKIQHTTWSKQCIYF